MGWAAKVNASEASIAREKCANAAITRLQELTIIRSAQPLETKKHTLWITLNHMHIWTQREAAKKK